MGAGLRKAKAAAKSTMAQNPMQPLRFDDEGIVRFKPNAIVRYLENWASQRGMSLNELAQMDFTEDDWMQFAQSIGYSLSGYGDLSYVSNASFKKAANAETRLIGKQP